MSVLLEIQKLSVRRGREVVLENLNTSIVEHQITGLTGPNGGGKTSLMEAVMGLLPISAGALRWSRKVDVAYVPQQLLPKKVLPLSVLDFVSMATWGPAKNASPALKVEEAIDVFRLKEIEKYLLTELSGGQWRRALLARCLAQPADFYLLDEPFNQLDLDMESRLGGLLRKLCKEMNKTFLIISHDWHAMDHYFDRLLLVNRRLISEGPVREVNEFYSNWKNPDHHERMHHL